MTSLRSQPRVSIPATPVRVGPPGVATRQRLRVRWRVARAALLGAGHDFLGGTPAAGPPLVLEIECQFARGRGLAAGATLHDPATGARHDVTPAPVRAAPPIGARLVRDAQRGLHHADVPGLLIATVRAGRAGIEVLYARTPLLAILGVRGGLGEPGGGTLDPAG